MSDLFIFGDSWPAGAELDLSIEQTFGEILATQLGKKFYNYSESSTSISHLILQCRDALKVAPSNSIFLFFLTSPNRDLFFKNNIAVEAQPQNLDFEYYYKNLHSDKLSVFRTNSTICTLQYLCTENNVHAKFLWGWDKVELWNEINQTNFYPLSCAEMFTKNYTTIFDLKNQKNQYIWPNQGHPNQKGHKLIANNLINWLKIS